MIFNLQTGRAQPLGSRQSSEGRAEPTAKFRIANLARRTRRLGLYRTCRWPNAVTVGRACSILSSATCMFPPR